MRRNEPKTVLKLPEKSYGPICNKILNDFMEHHNIIGALPQPNDHFIDAFSKIFDILLLSMGEKKRRESLDEVQRYSEGLDEMRKNATESVSSHQPVEVPSV